MKIVCGNIDFADCHSSGQDFSNLPSEISVRCTHSCATQLMVMCGHKKKHQEDQVQVCIGEALLHKQDYSVKYLGVTVDKQLSWKSHIANVRGICLGKIASIRRSSVYLPK